MESNSIAPEASINEDANLDISLDKSLNKESSRDDDEIPVFGHSKLTENISPLDKTMNNSINESKTEEGQDDTKEEWLDILGSGQLKKKVLKQAENNFRPSRTWVCKVNIEGRLTDGTFVEKLNNFSVQIGDGEVIQGVDLALPLMDVGETALLEVGPRFGFGSLGLAPIVPPNATLLYTVELLSAEDEPELAIVPASKRKVIGNRKRERGNWWYTRQEHTLAIQCYRRALDFLDESTGEAYVDDDPGKNKTSEEDLNSLLEDRLKVYNNLAAAQMKIKAYDAALQSVENVLRCQPENVKALFRKGKIMSAKGDNAGAVEAVRKASQLEPDSKMIRQELLRLVSLRNEDNKLEKNLYKKMLGQKNKPQETNTNSKKQIPWGMMLGSMAAVVVGVAAFKYRFM
uniref:peptidylprolyl isomerase n=1 Tax=Timema tahoe TaxID=61484 RepID=A0A7R9FH60_9NEOP|nr:unnamed protein product [Timema tahoe]